VNWITLVQSFNKDPSFKETNKMKISFHRGSHHYSHSSVIISILGVSLVPFEMVFGFGDFENGIHFFFL
jgi:hypothetical protein